MSSRREEGADDRMRVPAMVQQVIELAARNQGVQNIRVGQIAARWP